MTISSPENKLEVAWCIEKGDSEPSRPLYLSLKTGYISWSYNSLDAFRMSRKEDAAAFASVFFSRVDVRIGDHGWM